jgi:hypothetical protein
VPWNSLKNVGSNPSRKNESIYSRHYQTTTHKPSHWSVHRQSHMHELFMIRARCWAKITMPMKSIQLPGRHNDPAKLRTFFSTNHAKSMWVGFVPLTHACYCHDHSMPLRFCCPKFEDVILLAKMDAQLWLRTPSRVPPHRRAAPSLIESVILK